MTSPPVGGARAAKAKLRRAMLDKRRALAAHAEHLQQASQNLCDHLEQQLLRDAAPPPVLLAYWALAGELSLETLLVAAHHRGVLIGLPRLTEVAGVMEFSAWQPGDPLVRGPLGVHAPAAERHLDLPAVLAAANLRTAPPTIIVPALALDRHGARLGFGQGYYDRFLSRPDMSPWRRIGVVHDACLVDRVPTDENDQHMHLIATPRELSSALN